MKKRKQKREYNESFHRIEFERFKLTGKKIDDEGKEN
jgi:hypothetical protein